MNLHELKIFVNLAHTLNFSRTSRECYITVSALSRMIQRLEEEAQVVLFDRDKRHCRLTEAGHIYLDFARQCLGQWEKTENILKGTMAELSGQLKFYCSVTASYSILPPLWDRMRSLYPSIQMKLQTGSPADAVSKVLNGEADLAVAARPESLPANLVFREIMETPLVIVAPRQDTSFSSMLEENPLPLEKIPLILAAHGVARKQLEHWLRKNKIKPHIYAEVEGNEAILPMVTLGCGVGILPRLVVDHSGFSKDVRILKKAEFLDNYSVGLCALESRLDEPIIRVFWEGL